MSTPCLDWLNKIFWQKEQIFQASVSQNYDSELNLVIKFFKSLRKSWRNYLYNDDLELIDWEKKIPTWRILFCQIHNEGKILELIYCLNFIFRHFIPEESFLQLRIFIPENLTCGLLASWENSKPNFTLPSESLV